MFKKKTEELINVIRETIRYEFDLFFANINFRNMNIVKEDLEALRKYINKIQTLEETIATQAAIIDDLINIRGTNEHCEFYAIKYYRDKHPYVYHNGELVSKDNMKKCWIMWDNESQTEIEVDT